MNTDDGATPGAAAPASLKPLLVHHRAPPALQRRIRGMLEREAARPRAATRARAWSARLHRALGRGWPLAASFAAGLLCAVLLQAQRAGADADEALAQQVVAGHVRALMPGHLTDVVSSDRHTVRPWFAGKLDYAPPVVDLAAQGFPLVGGRLDYVGGRSVAALVYRRDSHLVDLYVLPAVDAREERRALQEARTLQGYNLVSWRSQGMQFWAVSDLERGELVRFAALLQGN
jgi:anti-sigma factor RsiW